MWNLANFLTLGNLLAGLLGIYFVLNTQPQAALYAMAAALIADYLDGWAARWLNIEPWIGKDLDSLADVVSFGALPSFMLFNLLNFASQDATGILSFLPFSAFALALFSALRLAKFNQDTRSADHFFGLPVPASATYFAGLYWVHHQGCALCNSAFINMVVLTLSLIFLCFLMISDVPHFKLKFQTMQWKGQEIKWIFVLALIPLILSLNQLAVTLAVVLYIFLSLVHNTFIRA